MFPGIIFCHLLRDRVVCIPNHVHVIPPTLCYALGLCLNAFVPCFTVIVTFVIALVYAMCYFLTVSLSVV